MSDEKRIVQRVWSLPGGRGEWRVRSVLLQRFPRPGATLGRLLHLLVPLASTAISIRAYDGTGSRSFPKVLNQDVSECFVTAPETVFAPTVT